MGQGGFARPSCCPRTAEQRNLREAEGWFLRSRGRRPAILSGCGLLQEKVPVLPWTTTDERRSFFALSLGILPELKVARRVTKKVISPVSSGFFPRQDKH